MVVAWFAVALASAEAGVRTIEVVDPDDERVAVYTTLRDGELGGHTRREHGVFVVEGPNPVAELVASPYEPISVLVERRRLDRAVALLEDADVDVYVAERAVFRSVVRFRLHQGIVALAARRPPTPVVEALEGARLVAAFEAINDHENLGVVCRSARALGIDAVLLGPRSCDPLYRRCVRVSMGHALHLPIASTGPWPRAVTDLHDHGLRTVALATTPDAVPLDRLADGVPSVLLLGAEGPGLTPDTVAAADVAARIPMVPGVDSLNVGVAASIAFHVLGRDTGRR